MVRSLLFGVSLLILGPLLGCGDGKGEGLGVSELREEIVEEDESRDPGVEIFEADAEGEEADQGTVEDDARQRARLQALREEGNREALRKALSATVLAPSLPARLRMRSLEELRDLNRALVYRGQETALAHEIVKVRNGENLTVIARRLRREHGGNVTPDFIIAVNRLPDARIRAGQTLAIPVGELEIVVRKEDYRLYLLFNGDIVRDFLVGLGREGGTPLGRFRVQGKTVDPEWKTPEGLVLPYGHPDHLIGNRWMGFDDESGRTGYGIHGTVDEDSIGKQESDGCIRLGKADVEELYRLFPEGGRVEVRP